MSGGWQGPPGPQQQPGPYGGGHGQPGPYPQQPGFPPPQPGFPPQAPGFPPPGQGPYGHPGPPYGQPVPPRRGNRLVLWIAVVVVLVAAGLGGFLLLNKDDDSNTANAGASESGKPGASGGGTGTKGGDAKGGDSKGGASAAPVDRPMVFPAAPPADAGPKFNATNDGKTWPKACEMLTDTQIGKVVKGAKVKSKKPDTTVSVKYDYPGAVDNQCTFSLEVPDPGEAKYPSSARIELTLNEVGTPATAKGHYSETKRDRTRKPFGVFEDLGTKLGTDDAFRDDAYIYFYKGPYFVQVYLSSSASGPGGARLPYDDFAKQVGPTLIGYLVARM